MKPPHRATESGGGAERRRLLSLAHGFPTRTLETDHEPLGPIDPDARDAARVEYVWVKHFSTGRTVGLVLGTAVVLLGFMELANHTAGSCNPCQ